MYLMTSSTLTARQHAREAAADRRTSALPGLLPSVPPVCLRGSGQASRMCAFSLYRSNESASCTLTDHCAPISKISRASNISFLFAAPLDGKNPNFVSATYSGGRGRGRGILKEEKDQEERNKVLDSAGQQYHGGPFSDLGDCKVIISLRQLKE